MLLNQVFSGQQLIEETNRRTSISSELRMMGFVAPRNASGDIVEFNNPEIAAYLLSEGIRVEKNKFGFVAYFLQTTDGEMTVISETSPAIVGAKFIDFMGRHGVITDIDTNPQNKPVVATVEGKTQYYHYKSIQIV